MRWTINCRSAVFFWLCVFEVLSASGRVTRFRLRYQTFSFQDLFSKRLLRSWTETVSKIYPAHPQHFVLMHTTLYRNIITIFIEYLYTKCVYILGRSGSSNGCAVSTHVFSPFVAKARSQGRVDSSRCLKIPARTVCSFATRPRPTRVLCSRLRLATLAAGRPCRKLLFE